MTALVTGGAGFVASHLAAELKQSNWDVVRTDAVQGNDPSVRIADLTDISALKSLVAEVKPDAVVHLGAISFVPDAAKDIELLWKVNVEGTGNLLAAVESFAPNSRFLFVSTSHVLNDPLSDYAKSKLAAEKKVCHSADRGLQAVIARPANHTGPGQSSKFVVPSFIRQAKEIKAGMRSRFAVGNLESVRDFSDVRDIVRAYRILLECGECKCGYNICSDCRMKIGDLLDLIASVAGVDMDYDVDEKLWRPADLSPVIDTRKIKSIGWMPETPIEQTIRDMLDYDDVV